MTTATALMADVTGKKGCVEEPYNKEFGSCHVAEEILYRDRKGKKVKGARFQKSYSILWNILLITAGAFVFSVGVKAIVVGKGFITGGVSGVGLLAFYTSGKLSPGIWYLIINLPLFAVGWALVSRRFFLYSLYGMAVSSLFMDVISFTIPVHDPFLAVLAGGAVVGAGAGITLHSLGSLGGNDIIAILMNQKYNVRMGTYFFAFNLVLFAFSFGLFDVDIVLYSLAMSFVATQVINHVLTMFNQRKMVIVISDRWAAMAKDINRKLQRGATFLEGEGTYSGRQRKLILTVVHNYQLKRLEELVFARDTEAFMITENTFNVFGKGFSRRKIY